VHKDRYNQVKMLLGGVKFDRFTQITVIDRTVISSDADMLNHRSSAGKVQYDRFKQMTVLHKAVIRIFYCSNGRV